MLDDVDRQILDILQTDARTSNAEIARRVDMAPSAVLERVRRLEQRGVIRGYGAQLDPRALERSLLAFVLVRSDERTGEISTGEALAREPDVLEVHHVAGQDSYLVKVRVRDPESLGRMLRERFGAIASVRATQSTIALETLKEHWALPIGPAPARERARV
ncbi:MAG TPA: Lrp/AsnC family transcriptional regulator [Candidatus Eisenbacteria bacterium]|nr:Lrp/AsnC family transcriptional regulator [Candidatus Eisenbacteria bacterium]